ncbi:MAG: L,D-transpeptidase [Rhizobiales bacterium]|nr:L,D-transpeptidase [Hyphomicrobiales bacterium]
MSLTRRGVLSRLVKSVIGGTAAVTLGSVPAFAETRYNFGSGDTWNRYRGKRVVSDPTGRPPGSIVVNTRKRKLYLVLQDGQAIEYGVGVGRAGFNWKGKAHIARKAEWPAWHPPKEMIARELKKYGRRLPARMEGGPKNPLGARALYLFQGNKDTLYRIHGTNAPHTIGRAMSSGCIRMINEEVIDLYSRVKVGAKVEVI